VLGRRGYNLGMVALKEIYTTKKGAKKWRHAKISTVH
jgi:hypothetical protein